MATTLQYYRLEEAEEIKKAYSAWIGKQAHIGQGRLEILTRIAIRPACDIIVFGKREKGYRVKFEFANKRSFDAKQFMINNGLTPVLTISTSVLPDKKQAG